MLHAQARARQQANRARSRLDVLVVGGDRGVGDADSPSQRTRSRGSGGESRHRDLNGVADRRCGADDRTLSWLRTRGWTRPVRRRRDIRGSHPNCGSQRAMFAADSQTGTEPVAAAHCACEVCVDEVLDVLPRPVEVRRRRAVHEMKSADDRGHTA